ncbi:hypothetical protein LOD99_7250 [Oopsacas minuta]|uniref:Uncharacterized protein n=1 Tax=Oopsacas minuta TaxID=111878 RepID=A0AAV7JTH9_9METZ|nr:hypothetical protein LOD99_7250 [Oopsacas minuta]
MIVKHGSMLVFVIFCILGICYADDNDELITPIQSDDEDNERTIEGVIQPPLTNFVEEQTDTSTQDIFENEDAKVKLAEAFIDRTKRLKDELPGSTERTETLLKRFEEQLTEKINLLSVNDIVDLMNDVLSQEEIREVLQEIFDSGVSEDVIVELLKVNKDVVVSLVKAAPVENIVKEISEVEDQVKVHKQLDTDLLELCQTNAQTLPVKHITEITLTSEEIEYLNHLLSKVKFSTETQLSVAFEWALNGTIYANYSNIMYRLLFGDEMVTRNFTLALVIANFLSDKGIPSGQNVLGYIYKSGYGLFNETDSNNTKPNPQTALTYYTFSALGGDVLSEMALGYRYQKGLGVTQSCPTSLVYYQRVGKKMLKQIGLSGGPALYKFRLSDDDDESANVNTMNQDLVEFFQMLAHKGDISSTNLLGQLFLQGTKGAARNVHTAIKYFELAALEDDETALVTLGMIYGDCTLKGVTDYDKAIQYLNRAIEGNSITAKAVLGFLYLVGLGVDQDFKRARQLIEPGVKGNNAEAILYFGIMMYYGYGVARNVEQALRHFIKVSESGNLLAIYYLAKVNADQAHERVPLKHCQTAVQLYKGVAERGYWSHLLMVAYKSYKEADYQRAYLIYSYLAELGYEVAQSNTAFLLENYEKQLFPQLSDPGFRAFHMWTRSADQGSSLSKIRLGDYNYYGIGRPVDYHSAVNEYKEAAKAQDPQAKFNMGYMYERGLGVVKDFPLAKRNYDECLTLEPDSSIAVHLALFNLLMTSQLDWVASNINLPFSINPISFFISFIINWDIYLITLLIMVLGLVYLMYKQHLAQFT